MGKQGKNVGAKYVATSRDHAYKVSVLGNNNSTNFTHNKEGTRHSNRKIVT